MRRLRGFGLLAFGLAACAHDVAPPVTQTAPPTLQHAVAARPTTAPPCPTPPPLEPTIAPAFAALVDGRLEEASVALEATLRAHPDDYAATVVSAALEAEVQATRAALEHQYREGTLLRIAAGPPAPLYRSGPVPPPVRLVERSRGRTRELVDAIELSGLMGPSPGKSFPVAVPRELGPGRLLFASTMPGGRILGFSSLSHRDFIIERPGRKPTWLEIAAGPDVTQTGMPAGAAVSPDGSVLVVQRGRVGRADDASLFGLDPSTGELLWSSEPGISAVERFVVGARIAITARQHDTSTGGTVAAIDLRTGRTLAKIAVTTSPVGVVARDGAVVVAGVDDARVVDVEPSDLVTRAASLHEPPSPLPPLDTRAVCALRHGVAALTARDAHAAEPWLADAVASTPGHRLATALEQAGGHLARGRGPDGRVDLTAVALTTLDPTPRAREPLGTKRASARLTRVYESADPKDGAPWARRFGVSALGAPSSPFSLLEGFGPISTAPDLPARFGVEPFVRQFEGGRPVTRYGASLLAITADDAVVATLETRALVPPGPDAWFDVGHAVESEGALFLGYATLSPRGPIGHLVATDPKSGRLAWRAEPGGRLTGLRVEPAVVLVTTSTGPASGVLTVYDREHGARVALAALRMAPEGLFVTDGDGKRFVGVSGSGVERTTLWVAELVVGP